MRIATALVCVAAACCVGGGMAQSAPSGSDPPPSVAKFALFYERGGGFAPDPRALRIKPGQRASAERSKPTAHGGSARSTSFRIGAKQIRRLRAGLERAGFTELVSPEPGADGCADCYLYKIEYRGHEVLFSDVSLPKALRPVVARIEGVIAHHLPFH